MGYGDLSNSRKFTEAGFEFTRTVDTPPNTIVAYGGLFGVTTEYIVADQLGWAASQGTFRFSAASNSTLTFAKGDVVTASVASNVGTIVQSAGALKLGRAVEAKAAGSNDIIVTLIQNV